MPSGRPRHAAAGSRSSNFWKYPTSTPAASSAWLIGNDGVYPARSAHGSGVTAAMCDGAVHSIPNVIDHVVYQRLGSRNDGVSVSTDF